MSLGRLFHLIHLTDDSLALDAWYRDVFDAVTFLGHHPLPAEKRDASLLAISDFVIEPLSPSFRMPGWEATPVGRSYQRLGRHWHSIAIYCDDPARIRERCEANDVRVSGTSTTIFTHPKDTFTQIQLTLLEGSRYATLDPRLSAAWDRCAWERHPLGLRGLAHAAVLCQNAEEAADRYVRALSAVRLLSEESPLTGTRSSYVTVGEVVIELAEVHDPMSLAGRDLDAVGPSLHAIVLLVGDLDRTADHLASLGISTLARDAQTLLTDPQTTGGVPFRWTTRDLRPT